MGRRFSVKRAALVAFGICAVALVIGRFEPAEPRKARDVGHLSDPPANAAPAGTEERGRSEEGDRAERGRADERSRTDAADSEKACRNELSCYAEKGVIPASVKCKEKIERLSNYSARWNNAWYEPIFSYYQWKDKDQGIVTYVGDKIEFQNGFGAYQNHVYTCDMVPKGDAVLGVNARPGRL